MTFEEYCKLSQAEILEMATQSKDEGFLQHAFYEQDLDIRLALCQNEALPLGKLKKYTNDKDLYLKQKAIEVFERRLVY